MLSPYRVLDLCDDRGIVCGFMLGELGADVICVEPPGGSSARRRGPFASDVRDILRHALFRQERGQLTRTLSVRINSSEAEVLCS